MRVSCRLVREADGFRCVHSSVKPERENGNAEDQPHLLLKLVVPGELCSCIDSEASGQATAAVVRQVERQPRSAVELVHQLHRLAHAALDFIHVDRIY